MNPTSAGGLATDHLLLAGEILGALEAGRMRMDARAYRDIASAALRELILMDTDELQRAATSLSPTLTVLVQNVLSQRGFANGAMVRQ